MTIEDMTSEDLIDALRFMARVENRIDRDALLYLFELERRGEIARVGFGRVFDFCVERLGMSEKAARGRAKAIGLMKRWPRAVEYLRDGLVTMSTLLAVDEVMSDE